MNKEFVLDAFKKINRAVDIDAVEFFRLRTCLEKGFGTSAVCTAFGDAAGGVVLALQYCCGFGRERDRASAIQVLQAMLDQGELRPSWHAGVAHWAIAWAYVRSGLPEAMSKCKEHLLSACAVDFPAAFADLGVMYMVGLEEDQDFQEGVALFKLGVAMNDPHAMYSLGMALRKGDGIDTDVREALKYYRMAGELGCAEACLDAAALLGVNTAAADLREVPLALHYLGLAMEQRVPLAYNNLAWYYEQGHGGSEQEALRLYRAASDSGYALATFNLGCCHYTGRLGAKQDDGEARRLWSLAAHAGVPHAHKKLAANCELREEWFLAFTHYEALKDLDKMEELRPKAAPYGRWTSAYFCLFSSRVQAAIVTWMLVSKHLKPSMQKGVAKQIAFFVGTRSKWEPGKFTLSSTEIRSTAACDKSQEGV